MTYNQLKALEKCAPVPVEYNPQEEQEHLPDMSEKVQGRVDQLRSKLLEVRSKARGK